MGTGKSTDARLCESAGGSSGSPAARRLSDIQGTAIRSNITKPKSVKQSGVESPLVSYHNILAVAVLYLLTKFYN